MFADIYWGLIFTPLGIPVTAIVCVFTWLTVASISESVAKVLQNRSDAELKLQLLSQGYAPEEIALVVEAGRNSIRQARSCKVSDRAEPYATA